MKKSYLIAAAAFVVVIIGVVIGLTSCGDPLGEPQKGDSVAPYLNTTELTTSQKLL